MFIIIYVIVAEYERLVLTDIPSMNGIITGIKHPTLRLHPETAHRVGNARYGDAILSIGIFAAATSVEVTMVNK